jgi:PGF-CTERM protein
VSRRGRLLAVALAAGLVLAALPGGLVSPAAAAVIEVDDDGSADYSSIAEAVEAADNGDRITVAPGRYDEPVEIDKPLTLVGDPGEEGLGPGEDAPRMTAVAEPAITISGDAEEVSVRGFVFGGGGTGLLYEPRAIAVEEITVSDNRFEGTDVRAELSDRGTTIRGVAVRNNRLVDGGRAVVEVNGGRVTTRGFEIADNVVEGPSGTGISVASTSTLNDVELEVLRNRVVGSDGDGVGVTVANGRNVTVRVAGNVIADNAGAGVALQDSPGTAQVNVRGNNLSANGAGVALRASASPERYTVQDNTIARNDQGVVNGAGPYLDARRNYWGGDRPSGATAQRLADPFAGLLLTGEGDSVPEGPIDATASVRVAPVLTEPAPVRVPPGPSPGSGGPQFQYVEGAVDRRAVETGERVIARVTYENTGGEIGEFTAFINLNRGERRIARETKRIPPGQSVTYQIPFSFQSTLPKMVYERANFLARIGVVERRDTVVRIDPDPDGTVTVNASDARADQSVEVPIPEESGNLTFDSVTITPERDIDVNMLMVPDAEAPAARLPAGVQGLRFFRITTPTFDDDIQRVAFRFTATKESLLAAGATPGYENVTLYRLDPATGVWERTGDLRVETDRPGDVTFLAETSGFSTYALGLGEPTFTVTEATLGATETRVGSPVAVNATVRNYRTANGTFPAELRVDEEGVATENVTIDAGAAATVDFEYTPTAAGTFNVAVNDRQAGQLQVATTTTTTTTTATTTVNTTTATTTTAPTTTTRGQPGFGTLLALLAVVAAALLAARRR